MENMQQGHYERQCLEKSFVFPGYWCQCCNDLDINLIFFHSALTMIKIERVLKMTEEARNVFFLCTCMCARVCV